MNINLKNKNIIIACAVLLFMAVIIFMIVRMNRMEERYLQLLAQQRYFAGDKAGKSADPYISGPVKNTVLKQSKEILECYREYLDRSKTHAGPKFSKEGAVTLDWQVDDDGEVLSPSVVRSSFNDAAFHSCIVKKIATWRFPEPPFGMKKYVEHTFKFKDEKK